MSKNHFDYRSAVGVVVIVAAIAGLVSWVRPAPAAKDKTHTEAVAAPAPNAATTPVTEEVTLVQLLEKDGLIDEVKGFLVEKTQNKLFIDSKQLPDNIAAKYIAALHKNDIRVQVYPFGERLRQHPNADLIQVLLPVMLSSPCVDTKPKAGC